MMRVNTIEEKTICTPDYQLNSFQLLCGDHDLPRMKMKMLVSSPNEIRQDRVLLAHSTGNRIERVGTCSPIQFCPLPTFG